MISQNHVPRLMLISVILSILSSLQAARALSSKLLHVDIPLNKTCQDAYNEEYLAFQRRRFPEWSTIINPEMQVCQNFVI